MKRALTVLSLLLAAGCASNDGFIDNKVQNCGEGSPVTIEVGWDSSSSTEMRVNDVTMLVRVANNSDEDITVKSISVDPMQTDRDAVVAIERGARDFGKLIPEGEDSTFEIPMMVRRSFDNRGRVRASSVDVTVTVSLEPDQSHRCRFRVPMPY
jgi:hypothetical protein